MVPEGSRGHRSDKLRVGNALKHSCPVKRPFALGQTTAKKNYLEVWAILPKDFPSPRTLPTNPLTTP